MWSRLGVALGVVCALTACAGLRPHERPAVSIPPEYQQEVQDLQEIINRYHARALPEITPHHAATHLRLGIIYYNVGELTEADYHLHQSIQMDPTVADAHFYLGRLLGARGRYPEAIAELRAALEIDPSLIDARLELGELHQAMEAEEQ
jgi:tetratricopeptide (TPR) repeat protein